MYSHDPIIEGGLNKSDGVANMEKLNKSDASNKSDGGGGDCDFTGMNISTVRNNKIKNYRLKQHFISHINE